MKAAAVCLAGLLVGTPAGSTLAADVPSPFLTQPGGGGGGDQMAALPDGDGREDVENICAACHSLSMVTQQRLSRSRWDELLNWMVEEQGMVELDPATRGRILNYLSTHLGYRGSG